MRPLANDIACPPRPVLLLFPAMNVHHLELFYYVAKHGGISAAVRHIPYGIQQPAVSGQMRALEENTGTQLFERTPLRLPPAGENLFARAAVLRAPRRARSRFARRHAGRAAHRRLRARAARSHSHRDAASARAAPAAEAVLAFRILRA